MYKVFFITFGCKVNQYETDSMRSEFVSQGFVETDSADDADIIINKTPLLLLDKDKFFIAPPLNFIKHIINVIDNNTLIIIYININY